MFGLGVWELVTIAVVVVVVFRPRDIPRLLRGLGRITRQAKELYRGATESITDLQRDIKEPVESSRATREFSDRWTELRKPNADGRNGDS